MVDTARNKSALATLFLDNTTGAISPQDLRDLMESLHPSYASLYISSSASTTLSVQNTWYKASGTTTDVNLHRFSGKTLLAVDNRLQYTGTPDIHIHGVMSFSSSTDSGTNKTLGYAAYHYDDSAASGSILTHSIVNRLHSNNDVGTGAIHFDAILETNDYIEFHVRCESDPVVNATIMYGYLFVMGVFI